MNETTTATDVESRSVGAPWYLRLGAWVGIGTGPGALVAGGGVAEIVHRRWVWAALALGGVVLTGLSVAHAWLGQRRREATVGLAADALGAGGGPRTVAMLIAVGTSLWTGFYIGIAAGAFGYLFDATPAVTAFPIAFALWLLHRSGFENWNFAVAMTGAAALAVGVLVFLGVPAGDPTGPPGAANWTAILIGAGTIVAYAAVFAVRVPDFTWDARRGRDTFLGGATLIMTLMIFLVLGAGIYLRAGSWELADLVNRTRLPWAGALLLMLSIVAPSVSGLHSAGLAVEHLTGWDETVGAGISASIAAVLGATRFDLQLVPFLNLLGAVVPSVLPVLLLRRPRHSDGHAWVAWLLGASVSVAALVTGVPAHILLGIAVSAAVMGITWLSVGIRNAVHEGAHR